MERNLFLIGNGFDIAHGLKTRYLDLLLWLYENDNETLKKFNKLLLRNFMRRNGYEYEDGCRYKSAINNVDLRIRNIDISSVECTKEYGVLKESCNYPDSNEPLILYALWESLEEYMYYFFLDEEVAEVQMERECLREVLESEEYGPVIESDIDIFDRPAQDLYDNLTYLAEQFKSDLLEWVYDVNSTISSLEDGIFYYEDENDGFGSKTIDLLPDNFFGEDDLVINFNYSSTVERLYSKKVLHIHGEDCPNNPPIMGHTKDVSEMYVYDERELVLVEEFYKDFDSILESHDDFFELIDQNKIKKVIVLGLGYNYTDYPYFDKISSLVLDAEWILYYFSEEDLDKAKNYAYRLKLQKIKYISIKENTPYTNMRRYQLDEE